MIALGLTLIFIWMGILVAAPLLLHKKCNVPTFYTRKILHIGTAFVWIIGRLCIGGTWHMFIPNTLSFLAIVGSYFMKPIEGIEENGEDGKKNYGTLYFAIATMILTAFNFSSLAYPCAGLAFCCLAFGDGFAAIVGKAVKKKFILCGKKTLVGLLTCWAISFAVAFVFNVWLDLQFTLLTCFAIAGLACLIELYTPFGLDNIFLPAFVMLLCVGVRLDMVSDAVLWVCALAPAFALITLSQKAFTVPAAAAALFLLIAFAWFSEYLWVVNIFVGYGFILLAKLVKKLVKKKSAHSQEEPPQQEKKGRNLLQLFSNLGASLILVIVHYFVENPAIMVGAVASFACAIGDSMASDIGVLQKKNPFDFCRWKRVERGVSGGVSLLGSVMAIIVIAADIYLCYAVGDMRLAAVCIAGGAAVFGVVIDSVLGSLVQARFSCKTCGKVTENKLCCGEKADRISGVKWIDNNMVNIISNCLSGIVALVVGLLTL